MRGGAGRGRGSEWPGANRRCGPTVSSVRGGAGRRSEGSEGAGPGAPGEWRGWYKDPDPAESESREGAKARVGAVKGQGQVRSEKKVGFGVRNRTFSDPGGDGDAQDRGVWSEHGKQL